jgi:uncharacterized protein YjbI with pentapeptide repeats
MIQAERAAVRPRVISPETGDAIPLEDLLLDSPAKIVEIVGAHGSGKTTALAHLAAVKGPDHDVAFVDNSLPPDGGLVQAALYRAISDAVLRGAKLVFTRCESARLLNVVSYRLAPWGDDEILEYLLAKHAQQCGSVLGRLKAAPDRHAPAGLPELWRLVLDRMAGNESLVSVSQALREELDGGLSEPSLRSRAETFSLAVFTKDERYAKKAREELGKRLDAKTLRLLRHDAVRLLLAADRLAGALERAGGEKTLERRLPRDLLNAVAAVASPTAIENLKRWIEKPNGSCHPMTASILHIVVPDWRPDRIESPPARAWLPLLSGAYLDGASWRAINLIAAALAMTDLSASDLTEAILTDAVASNADFSHAALHGASLLKIQAKGANFSNAVLTSINASNACFSDALFVEADLTDARLVRGDFQSADLTAARLVRADLTGAILTDAKIEDANFSSADLSGATLTGLKLREARFDGTKFAHAVLHGCDLEGMELPSADFSEAQLQDALLTGTRIPGADFTGANLRGARLADVDWEGGRSPQGRPAGLHVPPRLQPQRAGQ